VEVEVYEIRDGYISLFDGHIDSTNAIILAAGDKAYKRGALVFLDQLWFGLFPVLFSGSREVNLASTFTSDTDRDEDT